MTVLDFTHPLSAGIPLFPGTPCPELAPLASMEMQQFRETRLAITSHTGTHMDAPAHLLPQGRTLDRYPVSAFVGPALAVDCTQAEAGGVISLEQLKQAPLTGQADFILLRTGWDRYWPDPDRYERGFPYLEPRAAQWLASLGLKGVGIDTLSVDPVESASLPAHRALLDSGLVILENLTGLASAGAEPFTLCALPLSFSGADGAPVRAVGLLGCQLP